MTSSARITLLFMMLMAAAPLALVRQTYATRGVVKTADPSAFVLSRFQKRGDITITLSPATHVEGVIRIGATVSVRYREEEGKHIATAVAVERPKPRPQNASPEAPSPSPKPQAPRPKTQDPRPKTLINRN